MDQQRSERPGVLEPTLVAIGLALVVSYRTFEPIWLVGRGLLALGLLTAGAYVVAYVTRHMSRRPGVGHALLLTMIVSQPVLLALWALGFGVSRPVMALELVLLFAGVAWAGPATRQTSRVVIAAVFAAVAAVPTLLGFTGMGETPPEESGPTTQYLFTSYHDLMVTDYEVAPDELQNGGALAPLPDGRLLLVMGSGTGLLLDIGDDLNSEPIELGLPIDVASYRALGRPEAEFYRVFDAMYDEGDLFVSYIHWDAEQDCYSLRLAQAPFDLSTVGKWTTRFESRPCVSRSFMTNTSGGRIAVLDPSHLLLTVGTFGMPMEEYDSWQESDYGKILKVSRDSWQYEIFSEGHRNPQGLLVLGDRIFSTEHGPHGGDELNLIEEGSDYGWPRVSYGTDYGLKTLALGGTPGDHLGFVPPIYSWVPSIGISNLIQVSDGPFPLWKDDLLIAALTGLGNGYGLFRVRLLEGRVVNVERIETGSRVRDLVQSQDGGELVLWDGESDVSVVRPSAHVFSSCSSCHKIRSTMHGVGPDLFGVVGRPVGRHDEFEYSPALRNYGGTWTEDRLDRFLANPQREIPGTTMEHEGIPDPAERAEIIQYLRENKGGRPRN